MADIWYSQNKVNSIYLVPDFVQLLAVVVKRNILWAILAVVQLHNVLV